jgi:integrase
MRLSDGNSSATHPSVLCSQLIRPHDSLLARRLEITGHCLCLGNFVRHESAPSIRLSRPRACSSAFKPAAISDVQHLLGHASVKTTGKAYAAFINNERFKQTIDLLDAPVPPKLTVVR